MFRSCFSFFVCLFLYHCDLLAHEPVEIDRSSFGTLSSSEAIQELKGALQRVEQVLQKLDDWKGKGELVETSAPPNPKNGDKAPDEFVRRSAVEFLSSRSKESLLVISKSVSPTIQRSVTTGQFKQLDEDLQFSCVKRPDGFYRCRPNVVFGEIQGFPYQGGDSMIGSKLA